MGRVRRRLPRRSVRRCRTSSWAGIVPGRSSACRAGGGTLRRGRAMGARILRRGGRVRMGRRPRARESRGTRRIPGGCSEDGSRLRRPSSAGRGRTGTSAPRGGLGAGEKLRERWLESTTKKTTSSRWRTRRGSGAHRHACHRLITLTSLYRWVERLGGTEKRAGRGSQQESSSGARRILRKSAGFGFFSFRGAEFAKGRARSGATRVG